MNIWDIYRVELNFLNSLCSSVPSNPEMISAWLDARAPEHAPPGSRTIKEINEEVFASLPDAETTEEQYERTLLVFQRDQGHLVMRAATIRAHIKDCSRQISSMYVGKIKGEKSFATRIINGVYLDEKEYWLPLLRGGEFVTKPDGVREKAVHARGPRGIPINALKAFEFVNQPTLRFTLKVLRGSVKIDDLETVLTYGGVHGYAGERGDGEGKYAYKIAQEADEDDGKGKARKPTA